MAVGPGVPYNSHTGNGVTRTFAFGFTVLREADLVVRVAGTETAAYTIAGIGNAAGGSITFTTAPAAGALVELELVIAVRDTEYQDNGDLLADTVNTDFDRLWQANGIANYIASRRTLRVPRSETLGDLPAASSRAVKVLTFDKNGAISLQPAVETLRGLGKLIYDYGAWRSTGTVTDYGTWG